VCERGTQITSRECTLTRTLRARRPPPTSNLRSSTLHARTHSHDRHINISTRSHTLTRTARHVVKRSAHRAVRAARERLHMTHVTRTTQHMQTRALTASASAATIASICARLVPSSSHTRASDASPPNSCSAYAAAGPLQDARDHARTRSRTHTECNVTPQSLRLEQCETRRRLRTSHARATTALRCVGVVRLVIAAVTITLALAT
jgi:hypothetical protein